MTTYDVIVIGLGAAGVAAVSELSRNGCSVLALEASDRIGGRVNTVKFGDGFVELGAEWIHGTVNNEVYNQASRHNIEVVPQDLIFKLYHSDGTVGDIDLFNELVAFCVEVIENPPHVPEPLGLFVTNKLYKYIEEKKPELLKDDDYIKEFLCFMNLYTNNYESSNDWCDVTTSSKYTELDGHQHMSWHRNGFKTVFDIILKTYKSGPGLKNVKMEFKKEVIQIVYDLNPQDVVVKCADNTQYRGKSVIVTVSLGVLKEKHEKLFTPPLPNKKTLAIEKMTIGVMDKVILAFKKPWWPKDFTFFGFIWRKGDKKAVPKSDYWITQVFGVSTPLGSSNTLTLWTSGEAAKLVETLPEDIVKRKSMELIRKFMGKTIDIPEPISMVRSTWYSNPYTRGSYSYDNLEIPNYPDCRQNLATPILDSSNYPRILFAGEATNSIHFSTVHGAIETGYREAKRILNIIKPSLIKSKI